MILVSYGREFMIISRGRILAAYRCKKSMLPNVAGLPNFQNVEYIVTRHMQWCLHSVGRASSSLIGRFCQTKVCYLHSPVISLYALLHM